MAASISDAFRSEDINIVTKRMTHTPIHLLHTHIWYQLFHQKTIHYNLLTYLSLSKLNQSSVPKSSLEILHLNNLCKTALPHPPSVSCTQLHYCRALIDTNDLMEEPWDSEAAIADNQVWWALSILKYSAKNKVN